VASPSVLEPVAIIISLIFSFLNYSIKIEIIKNSKLDNEKLSEIKILVDDRLNRFDFSKVIVEKPWGYEYLIYKGKESSIWGLKINKDYLTSMHCHLNKKTALLVLSGEVICSTLKKSFNLKERDGIVFDKRVFHSTKSISDKGAVVMEVETPPKKTDLIRLSDNYGRKLKGYELQNEMCFDLSKYEHIYFNENEEESVKKIGKMDLCISNLKEDSIKEYLKKYKGSLIFILDGKLINKKNKEIFEVGDVFKIDNSEDIDSMNTDSFIKVLKITKNER